MGEVRNSKQHEQQNLLDQCAQAEPSKEAKLFFKKSTTSHIWAQLYSKP